MTKHCKKSLSLFLCFIMVLTTFVPVFSEGTKATDYSEHWAKETIQSAIDTGLSKGYPDGSFKPDNAITRAEFFALVNNTFGFKETSMEKFSDVSADAWYAHEISKAKAAGYIAGYPDGTIHPNGNITRQEAAAIMSRIKSLTAKAEKLTFVDAATIADWGKNSVIAVYEAKIMSGYPDGSFKPQEQIKRAEALVAVNNSFKYAGADVLYDKSGTYGSATTPATIDGNVVIKAAGVILQNTIIKGNLTISKEVGNGDVTLKNVIIKGNTYVNGGGVNSIYFVDVTTGKVYIQKDDGPVRIVASGTSTIKEVMAGSDIKLEEVNMTGSGFEGITVEKTVTGGVEITLTGVKCESIDIKAEGVTLSTDATSTVKTLTVDAKNTVIEGKGAITNANVNAGGVTFEKAPLTITTAPGVTAPVVTAPVVIPPVSSGGGGGGNNTPITPSAPSVTKDDKVNTVSGMTTSMEYKLDTDEYVPYIAGVFGALDLSGNHTLLIRISAEGINPVSAATTLIFTENTLSINSYESLKTSLESGNYTTLNIDAEIVIPTNDILIVPTGTELVVNNKIIISDGATLSNSGTINSSTAVAMTINPLFAAIKHNVQVDSPRFKSRASGNVQSSNEPKIEVQGSGTLQVNTNSIVHFDSFSDIITPSQSSMLLYSGAKVRIANKQYLGNNSDNALIELSNFDGSNAPVAGWFLNGDGVLLLIIFERATVIDGTAGLTDISILVKGENEVAPGELVIPNWQIFSDDSNDLGGGVAVESNAKLFINQISVVSASDETSVFNAVGGDLDNRRGIRFTKNIIGNEFEINVNIRGTVSMNKELLEEEGMTVRVSPGYFSYSNFRGTDLRAKLDVKFTPEEGYFTGWYWDLTTPAEALFENDTNGRWIDQIQKAELAAVAIDKVNAATAVDNNASLITWQDLFNTGVLNSKSGNLSLYKIAIESANVASLGTVSAIQTLVTEVNIAPLIALISNAAGNSTNANALTINNFVAIGVLDTNPSYIDYYRYAVQEKTAGSLTTVAAIQTLIDETNPIAKIAHARWDDVLLAGLTIGDFTDASTLVNVSTDRLLAYKAVLGRTSTVNTVADLQEAIDTANEAVDTIASAAGSVELSNQISLDHFINAGIQNCVIDKFDLYHSAIASAAIGSIDAIAGIQALIDTVNVQP